MKIFKIISVAEERDKKMSKVPSLNLKIQKRKKKHQLTTALLILVLN